MDVQLPDGSIARFPDSMSEQEVRTQLLKIAPPKAAAATPATAPAAKASPYPSGTLTAASAGAAAGLTGNFFDEIAAATQTPIELAMGAYNGSDDGKGLWDRVSSSYDRALQKNRDYEKGLREEHPIASTVGDVAGGLALGGTAATNGLTLMRAPAQAAATIPERLRQTGNMLARAGGEGAAYGAVYGAGSGEGAGDRVDQMLGGATTGALMGAGLGAVAAGGGLALNTFATPIAARVSPDVATRTILVRDMQRAGMQPNDIVDALQAARADGQDVFTVADALGHPGQRRLSTIVRTPGEGRTEAVRALEARQTGQGERLGAFVDDALGANGTARQSIADLNQQARQASAPLYRQAYDVGPVHSDRLAALLEDPIARQGLRQGVETQRLEALAQNRPFSPEDLAITGFNDAGDPILGGVPNMRTIQAVKSGLDDIMDTYRDPTTGRVNLDTRGRAIDMYRRALLEEVDTLNPAYEQARAAYAGPASITGDVERGQMAATRGRAADNVALFNSRPAANQQGFRQGYADALQGRLERTEGEGTNRARPFTSAKSQQEMTAFAQTPAQADRFGRQIGREQTMFETRRQASGGSQSADNIADQAEFGSFDPSIVGNAISGNWLGVVRQSVQGALNQLRGMPQPVRNRVATILLQTDPTRAGVELAQAIAQNQQLTNAQVARLRAIAQASGQQTGTGQ